MAAGGCRRYDRHGVALQNELVVVEPRVGRYLARTAAEGISTALTTTMVVWLLYAFTKDSGDFGSVMLFFGGASTALFFGGGAVLKRLANALLCLVSLHRAVEVALDEGGIRFSGRGGLTYWPLEKLDEPMVIGRRLGRVELVLAHTGGEASERVVLFHPQAIADAQQLERELGRRLDALLRELPPGAQLLEPRGQPLTTWLERIEQAVSHDGGGAGFRGVSLGREQLKAWVRDVRIPATVRAAGAYGLLHVAPGDAPALLDDLLHEASPPILVAMVALAATSRRVVENELIAAAMPYVEDEMRSAVLQAALRR